MMGAGHTPGPWKINPAAKNEIVADGEVFVIARLPGGGGDLYGKSIPANGRLIAAAPESHAANIEAADFIRATFGPTLGDNPEGWSDLDAMRVCRQLEAAIAKARGEA